MRCGKSLVQVNMNDVEAHIAGLDFTEYGVEVRAVVIQQPARLVDDFAHFSDVLFKHPKR